MKKTLLFLALFTGDCTAYLTASEPLSDAPDIAHSAVSTTPLKDWFHCAAVRSRRASPLGLKLA
jgi:hypothetical protein